MQSASYQLFHSAKGTSWQSKDHKYIAIENGRYIYPEDMKGGKKKSGVSGSGMTPSEYRSKVTQNYTSAVPVASGNVQYAGKKVTPSEYRALVASGSKSINSDGSLRENSAAARGDVQGSMGTKKSSKTTLKTKGLQVYTPKEHSIPKGAQHTVSRYKDNTYKGGHNTAGFTRSTGKSSRSSKAQHGIHMNNFAKMASMQSKDSNANTTISQLPEKAISSGRAIVEQMFSMKNLKESK